MQIIRGTTPTITVNVRSNINLSLVDEVWLYIYQQGNIVIDKQKSAQEVSIDQVNKKITTMLTQEDTLALKADVGALFQVRLLLSDSNHTALASLASNVVIKEIYKGGEIGGSTNE